MKRGERTPNAGSGFVEQPARAAKIAAHIRALSYSVWYRSGVMVVSALEMADAPDGRGDMIPQWHISIAGNRRRSTDVEVRQTLVCFGMMDAEEDNHHPGVARHFWLTVDPARRVDCECKTTEETIVEMDGYRWQNSKNPSDCHGCEISRETGGAVPCTIHSSAGQR